MKPIRLILIAVLLSSLSSCGLIGSILKIPASLIKSVGRAVGVGGLTDESADPIKTSPVIEAPAHHKPSPADDKKLPTPE